MKEKNKIKIAFFTDVLKENMDGVTHTLYKIIERIPNDKFEYLFITPFPPSKDIQFPYPIHICRYFMFPLYNAYPVALPFMDRKLRKVLDEFQPDIIHFTTPALLGLYAVKYALKNRIPLFHTYHTHFMSYIAYYFKFFPVLSHFLIWLGKRITKWFLNSCDMTFIPTAPIMEELIDTAVQKDKMIIWGRGVDSTVFSPANRDEAYIDELCGKNSFRLLFVSRLVWEKEIQTLVKVYNYFNKVRPFVKMVITGDGPQSSYMRRKMPNAVFTGKLMGKELARIYASCDIFVFPSITETFGNVVLEALASGLPAVVAAQGGPKGIIRDGSTGFHVVPKNSEDFCKKLCFLIDNPDLLNKMKKNAAAYARSQSWDTLCKEMFAEYEKHLTKNNEMIEEEKNEIAV